MPCSRLRVPGCLQDNVRFGNEAQLLGGYAAGWLLLSALTALAYLGLWLRCLLLLLQLDKVCVPRSPLTTQVSVRRVMLSEVQAASS